jgi:hypothetical protein
VLQILTQFVFSLLVVHQFYQTRVIDEFVLKGNTATLKCLVPSFVSDFVEVVEWLSDDQSLSLATNENGKDTHLYFCFPIDTPTNFTSPFSDRLILRNFSIEGTFLEL